MIRFWCALLVAGWLACGPCPARCADTMAVPPGIVLLTSYHEGDVWNDRLVSGFLAAFTPETTPVYIEHMDSRRFADQRFRVAFAALLAAKYADTPIKLLVAADDPALDFWLECRNELFPGRPVVFCGINDFSPSRLAGHPDITGVTESPDVLGTLEMALAMRPETGTVVALGSDAGVTSQASLARFRRAALALGRRLRTVEMLDVSLDQAVKALAALPRDAVVLWLGSLATENGRRLPIGEETARLAAAAPVPLLGLWDFQMNTGALGGRVVSAAAQGRAAAGVVLRILAGESPAAIPVAAAPNQPMVDYRALERFDIPERDLPAGTVIINVPAPFYERYKPLFWGGAVALGLLLPASLVLAFSLAGRRAAEARRRESEGRYRELVENAGCLILRYDRTGRLVYVNEYTERMLGAGLAELPDLLAASRQDGSGELSGLLARAMAAPDTLERYKAEQVVMTRHGNRVVISWDNRLLRGTRGECTGWLTVGTDVTARRRAEDGLAARMLADEEMLEFCRELVADAPEALDRALRRLLTVFAASRGALFENCRPPRLGLCCRLRVEALGHGLTPHRDNPTLNLFPYAQDAFGWANRLGDGEIIAGQLADFPSELQEILEAYQVSSVMAAPVSVDGAWHGFVAVGDARGDRVFSREEQTRLATAAAILSAHLSRPCQA